MEIRHLILLSAYLLSDGGITPRGKNSWTIYFRNRDISVITAFQKQLKYCAKRTGYITKRKDGSYFIKLHSTKLGKKLLKISNSYRTKACKIHPICPFPKINGRERCITCKSFTYKGTSYPIVKIPQILFQKLELAKEFLKIYATCDGGVSVTFGYKKGKYPFLVRRVFIAVKHPLLAKQLMKLLKISGYHPYYYERQIRLTKKNDILRFYQNIKFLRGAKISKDSKFLHGYEKNYILNLTANSYEKPKKLLNFLLTKRSSSGLKED